MLSPLPGPHRQARIDATVAAPGPHDFAVRSEHHSSIVPLRPSHPAARFVTIASRPFAGRDGEAYATNPNFCKQEYLCARGLTGFRVICPTGPVCRTLPVIPGRCEASSPESITAKEVGVHSAAPDNCRLWYGFRARAKVRPGMTKNRWTSPPQARGYRAARSGNRPCRGSLGGVLCEGVS